MLTVRYTSPCLSAANNMRLKILVFPCGSEIGLEIHRSIATAKEVVLFGGSSVSDHGEFVYENYISDIPDVSSERFVSEINSVVQKYQIDVIIPAHDSVILKLAEALNQGALSCKLLTSPYETCVICRSKQKTNAAFSCLMPVPILYNSLDSVQDWPVFVKPDVGCGSKGASKCESRTEAEYYLSKDPGILILEYLPGREYTIDCFTDSYGRLLFCGGRERVRISNGISVRTVPVEYPEFLEMAEIINKKLRFQGAWFFQVKENKSGRLALMEIAPRVAGAMGLYRNLGINFPLLSLYDAAGHDIKLIHNNFPIVFDRALASRFRVSLEYQHVYVDFDDCIVIGGKLNLQMVAFLYQCLNRGVGISLLTRHAGNLDASLKAYRLAQLFDVVVNIKDSAPKSEYIKEPRSIFIDDSFSERQEVKFKTGVPVFAPDAVESLLLF